MQARLKVLHDKANVKQVKLLPVTLIGRSTECNLKIASSQVSRNHCRITLSDDAVFVEDLGSANGTLVDGQPLPAHQPTAIAPGTHLIVGPAEFQIDFVAPSSPTLVLNRGSSPITAELPSTEMIFPVTSPNASFPAPEQVAHAAPAPIVTQPVVAQEVPAAAAIAAVAVAAVVETPFVPQAPAVAEWQPPVVSGAPSPEMAAPADAIPTVAGVPGLDASAAARAADTEILDSGSQAFGFEVDEEAAQVTQFMFAETVPDSIPFESSAPPKPDAAAKKGGLKSLFSLFGRKDKPAGATHSASVTPQSASAPPSVFLPTVETQPLPEEVAVEVVNFEQTEGEVDSSTDTAEFTGDQPPPTSTEENDDFQQFISQF